jgi:hypothetical protein
MTKPSEKMKEAANRVAESREEIDFGDLDVESDFTDDLLDDIDGNLEAIENLLRELMVVRQVEEEAEIGK